MATDRIKATIVLSSDHAGINRVLGHLEAEMLRVLANINDPRRARDFVTHLRVQALLWATREGVDMRTWIERTRKRAG